MDVQLPGRIGQVQILLEEHVDGVQHFLIEQPGGAPVEQQIVIIGADVLGQLHQEALEDQAVEDIDAVLRLEHATHLDGPARLGIAFPQLIQGIPAAADAHGHLMGRFPHQGFLQGLGVHGQILHGLHVSHVLNQHHRVPVHVHQHVPLLHRGDIPQKVKGALVFRLHHMENHDTPLQLLGNLMLVAQGLQLRAGQIAP